MSSQEKINLPLISSECNKNTQKLTLILFLKLMSFLINIRNLNRLLIIVKRKLKEILAVFLIFRKHLKVICGLLNHHVLHKEKAFL